MEESNKKKLLITNIGPGPEVLNIDYHKEVLIHKALKRTNGNVKKSSELLGITVDSLYYLLERFSIKASNFKKKNKNETNSNLTNEFYCIKCNSSTRHIHCK